MIKFLLTLCLLIFVNCHLFAQSHFDSIMGLNKRPNISKLNLAFKDSFNHHTTLPVLIIKGKNEGSVLTITAGVHGAELAPIIASQELIKEIDPSKLSGTLIILPITNIGAFYGYTPFINPIDKRNINRLFPGRKDGTISEKIAYFISTKIIPLSDVFIDAHSGDSNEDLLPFVCFYENNNFPEQTEMAKQLSQISGFRNVISYPYTLKNDQPAKFVFKQASQKGKVALSFESGKLGYIQKEAVEINKRGFYRILNELGMYSFNDPLGDPSFKVLKSPIYIDSKSRGIFYTKYKAGDQVINGEKLGYITNEFGDIIENIYSTATGTIIYMKGVPPTNIDDTLFSISPNK